MNKDILKLAIPNIISNISVPLLSAVDTALMGHLSSTHLAAIGISSMIFVFIYGSFGFLRMGTTGITAQFFGSKNEKEIYNTLLRAMIVATILAFTLIVFKDFIFDIAIYLMNIDSSYKEYAHEYFNIRIYAALAQFLQFAIFGWFFGVQNALIPLYVTILINIVNAIFSIYFVRYMDMGIDGVAYGTLISQYIGLVVLIFLLYLRFKRYKISICAKDIFVNDRIKRFFVVNKDIFIRTMTLTFVLAFFYSQAAKYSKDMLATMTVLMQFLIWFSFGVDGFANATESLVGRFYGAKDWKNFYKAIRYNFYYALLFTIFYMLIYYNYYDQIVKIYSSESEIIASTKRYFYLVLLLPIFGFAAFVWDGVFVGMTASKALRNTILLSSIPFFGAFYLFRSIDYGYALFGSFLLFFLFRGIIQSYIFYNKKLNLK